MLCVVHTETAHCSALCIGHEKSLHRMKKVQGSKVVQMNLDTRKILAGARCHAGFGQGLRGFEE